MELIPLLHSFIIWTTGAVLHLFLFILLIGYRQRRSFEAVLSVLFFSVFLGYAGFLLGLNALYYYESPRDGLATCADILTRISIFATPPLLLHSHTAYQRLITASVPKWMLWIRNGVYAASIFFILAAAFYAIFRTYLPGVRTFAAPLRYVNVYWPIFAFLAVGFMQVRFGGRSKISREKSFHFFAALIFVIAAGIMLAIVLVRRSDVSLTRFHLQEGFFIALYTLPILLSSVFAYNLVHPPFLRLVPRRNLVLAVVSGFAAVLFLTLASRISQWLEGWFPPVATISILVFVLVFLYEPLQRALSRGLQRLMREEVEKVQRVLTAVHNEARGGN